MLIQEKNYKNLFTDLLLIKYNIWNKKKYFTFFIFLKYLVTDKILQLYNLFFIWFFTNEKFDANFKKIVQKDYYFVLELKPRNYINFLFNYLLFCNFKDSSQIKVKNYKMLNYSLINMNNKLSEFFLLKCFFKLKSLKIDAYFFKSNLIFVKDYLYYKENILLFFLSFFKKNF